MMQNGISKTISAEKRSVGGSRFFNLFIIFILLQITMVLCAPQPMKREKMYTTACGPNKALDRSPISTHAQPATADSSVLCASLCEETGDCSAFNFRTSQKQCELFNLDVVPDCAGPDYVAEDGAVFIIMEGLDRGEPVDNPCMNGGTWDGARCRCVPSWAGTFCDRLARDCSEIFDSCPDYQGEGMVQYTIKPDLAPEPFPVLCYMGWGAYTVVQYREGFGGCDADMSFNRTWAEYKAGFGSVDCTFWLGLDKLYYHTNNTGRVYTMDVTVGFLAELPFDFYQSYYYDTYVENEASDYRLHMAEYWPKGGENQLGDALLAMEAHRTASLMPFSTHDRDNDASLDGNCASTLGSGWWFNDCGAANPNGAHEWTEGGMGNVPGTPSMWWDAEGWGSYSINYMNIKFLGEDV